MDNREARFRVSDVYVPEPQEVLNELYRNEILQGVVVGISSDDSNHRLFAVIKVSRLTSMLLVPIAKVAEAHS